MGERHYENLKIYSAIGERGYETGLNMLEQDQGLIDDVLQLIVRDLNF